MSELTTMVAPQVDEMALIESSGRRFVLAGQFAHAMCRASVLPEHLRTRRIDGKVIPFKPDEIEANCVMIANQALRWGVDPFAILPSTYVVGGKLGFDGKLIAAIVNQRRSGQRSIESQLHRQWRQLDRHRQRNFARRRRTADGVVRVAPDVRTSNEIWRKKYRNKSCGIPARLAGHRHIVQRCCWGF